MHYGNKTPEEFADGVGIVNASEAIPYAGVRFRGVSSLWLFQFGAIGTTYVAVWNGHLEEALEEVAGWLADNAPGHIVPEEDMEELYEEAAEDLGLKWDPSGDWDEDQEAIAQQAEADLTRTESGWIVSYEWWVDEIDPKDELYGLLFERSVDEIDDLDDDDAERANEVAEKIGIEARWE